MKKLLYGLFALIVLVGFGADLYAASLQRYDAGFRTIDGNQLNKMVDVVNGLTGNGTAQPVTGTTGVFSSTLNVTGATALAGGLTLTGVTSASGVICGTYAPNITPAATDKVFFIATRAMRVVSVSQIHTVAAGGASALQVTKDTGTDAPGAGTDLLTNNTNAGFDLNATANTVQVGTLVATAGVVVTACMAPL